MSKNCLAKVALMKNDTQDTFYVVERNFRSEKMDMSVNEWLADDGITWLAPDYAVFYNLMHGTNFHFTKEYAEELANEWNYQLGYNSEGVEFMDELAEVESDELARDDI